MAEGKEKKEKEKTKKPFPKILIILAILGVVVISLVIFFRIVGQSLVNKLGSTFLSRFLVKDGQVKVSDGGKKISYSGKEGEFSFETEGKLPEGFPSDFPLYPGAKISSSWNASSEESKGYSLILETEAKPGEVDKYYKEELVKKGWKITSQFTDQESFTYTFEKGSLNGLVGIAVGEEGKTAISVTIGAK